MKNIFKGLLVLKIALFMFGCEDREQSYSNENIETQKSSVITESDVAGFYTGRGMYNAANATLDLYYGGSFVMEDPYLPSGGTAYGKWVFQGSSIDFYIDGQKTFSASVSKRIRTVRDVEEGTDKMKVGGLILNGQMWKKVR